jgi:hypothetical protein
MRTDSKADETALMLLDYTTPSLFDVSDDLPPMDDHEAPEFPWAPAWSTSPLGDPGVDDDVLASVGEYAPRGWAPRFPVAALAAAALGMLGLGVLVGVTAVDLAVSRAPLPAVTIVAHSEPAPPSVKPLGESAPILQNQTQGRIPASGTPGEQDTRPDKGVGR